MSRRVVDLTLAFSDYLGGRAGRLPGSAWAVVFPQHRAAGAGGGGRGQGQAFALLALGPGPRCAREAGRLALSLPLSAVFGLVWKSESDQRPL